MNETIEPSYIPEEGESIEHAINKLPPLDLGEIKIVDSLHSDDLMPDDTIELKLEDGGYVLLKVINTDSKLSDNEVDCEVLAMPEKQKMALKEETNASDDDPLIIGISGEINTGKPLRYNISPRTQEPTYVETAKIKSMEYADFDVVGEYHALMERGEF